MLRTLLILLVACGGKSQPAAAPAHAEHAEMSPELAKFHDVLAPLWHAPESPDRMKNACTATSELVVNADAIAKAPAKSAAWTERATSLVDAVRGLQLACADQTGLDPAFAKVHEAFHALLDSTGGEHD